MVLAPAYSGLFERLQQKRNILAIMAFLGFFNVYALRVNLSVAAVHMQDHFNWSATLKGFFIHDIEIN
jgi:hypothetical protein